MTTSVILATPHSPSPTPPATGHSGRGRKTQRREEVCRHQQTLRLASELVDALRKQRETQSEEGGAGGIFSSALVTVQCVSV